MKKAAIFTFLLLASSGLLKSQVLSVNEVIQEQNQWCWAAVSACALQYYCYPKEQCEIAEYTRTVATWHNFGTTDCCVNPNLGCNYWNYNWGYPGSIQDILLHFGNIQNSGIPSSINQTAILSDIQNNRLFIIRWGWTSGGGHFIVGHGLVDNNLYYMDPWYGEGLKIADYAWVVSGGNHTWTHTNRITATPNPNLPGLPGVISGETDVCQGDYPVTYSIQELEFVDHYQWTLPDGATGSSNTNTIEVSFGSSALSGAITVAGANNCGTGGISSLEVNVNEIPPTPTISLIGNILYSDAPDGNQWYDQNGIIEGAIYPEYTFIENGEYYVIVTLSGCSSEPSNVIVITGVNSEELTFENEISVFPNPVSDQLVIKAAKEFEPVHFKVLNNLGQIITQGILKGRITISTADFDSGIYLIRFDTGEAVVFEKIVKE
jgi:hypothetical protein